MKNRPAANSSGWTNLQIYTAIVVVLLLGGIGGYLLSNSGRSTESSTASPAGATLPPSMAPSLAPSTQQVTDQQAQPLLARLQSDPKDVSALIALGNLYYDAGQWSSAIGYYNRALNENPSNADVRTDLGTAYFNTGDSDRALQEFDRALKDDPRHGHTLFNIGVAKLNGTNDPKGAIAAWENLLRLVPNYPDRARVESMLAAAKARVQ